MFGVAWGVFLTDAVDELCYNSKGEMEINELKTQANHSINTFWRREKERSLPGEKISQAYKQLHM